MSDLLNTTLTVKPPTGELGYGAAHRAVVERSEEAEEAGEMNFLGYIALEKPEEVLLFTGDPQSPETGDVLWTRSYSYGERAEISAEDLAGDAAYQVTRRKLIEAAEQGDVEALLAIELSADTGLGEHSLREVRGQLVDCPELKERYFEAWSGGFAKHAADMGITTPELLDMLSVCGGDVEAMIELAARVPSPTLFVALYQSGYGLTIDQAVVFCRHSIYPEEISGLLEICGDAEQAAALLSGVTHNHKVYFDDFKRKVELGFTPQQAAQLAESNTSMLAEFVSMPGGESIEEVFNLVTGCGDTVAYAAWHMMHEFPGVSLNEAFFLALYRERHGLDVDLVKERLEEMGMNSTYLVNRLVVDTDLLKKSAPSPFTQV